MSIVTSDLDTTVRSQITDAMREELYYRLKTLPMSTEVDKIKSVVQGEFKNKLDGIVIAYYRAFSERDVDCQISDEDYVGVYLGKA